MSTRKTGVILSYLLMIFEIMSTLLLTPYIIRTLGSAEYGVYKLVAAVNAYLLLLDLGIGNAIIRYIAKYRVEGNLNQSRKFMGIATVFYLVIAGIAIICGFILVILFPTMFSKGLTQDEVLLGQKLLCLAIINTAVTLGTTAYTNVLIAYERFVVSRVSSILQIVFRVIFSVIALKYGMGAVGILTVNLVFTVLCRGYFVFYVICVIKLKPQYKDIEFSYIKEIIGYSSLILLQMIATQLNASVDQVLIGSLVQNSATVLAIYGVGSQIVQYFQSIGSAFSGVLMPGVVKMVENKSSNAINDEMLKVGRMVFMILSIIWGCFLVAGRRFVVLWAGNGYEEAYWVTLILITAYIFILTESIGAQILWAMNEHKEQAILKIVIVVTNILLTIFLIRWNPLIGATIGTFISLILGDVVVMNVILAKKLHMKIAKYFADLLRGTLPALLISIVFGLGVSLLMPPDGVIAFVLIVLLMLIVYSICMIAFGMNKKEKEMCRSIVGNLLHK